MVCLNTSQTLHDGEENVILDLLHTDMFIPENLRSRQLFNQ